MTEPLALPEPEAELGTVALRKAKQKELLLDNLQKAPIVQLACERSGISRATYYRWHNDDEEFAQAADEAIDAGSVLVNDLAKSQLLGLIRSGNMTAIAFWLRHNDPKYSNKVELTANIKTNQEELTPEQQAVVDKALQMASLIAAPKSSPEENTNDPANN